MLETLSWQGAFRAELRAEAIGLASRGWPVVAGTYPSRPGWTGTPEPAHADWQATAGEPPAMDVVDSWVCEPYNVLVATGTLVDAVEVDDDLGRHAARLLRETDRPAPILAMPNGKWVFLTESGNELPAELAARPGVRWHGEGSWVPLPPSAFDHGIVHWRVKPEMWGWRPPHAGALHGVLARAAHALQVATVAA